MALIEKKVFFFEKKKTFFSIRAMQ